MPILFSAVARDEVLLGKFASCDGNFLEIADQVLSRLPSRNEKVTYFHGHYLIHYIVEDHHLYFCITDKRCQRSRAFLFLNQIRRRIASEGRAGLTQLLADEMYHYSDDDSTIVIREGELDELNRIGVRSSEEILGEKLLLVKNTDNLNFGVISYVGTGAAELYIHGNNREKRKLSYLKVVIALFLLGLVFIYILDFRQLGHVIVSVMLVIFLLYK